METNQYVKQFPELMKGKTVMYVHGFGSSGQSGTVKRLREVLPSATVIAPDLPVQPEEAMALLRRLCDDEQPDLILGTSMGGMYTEQLYGFDRICMNPALCIADTMQQHGMTGTQTFQNPRQDGVQTFYVDKALVKAYRTVSEQRFFGLDALSGAALDEEWRRVYGLFGDEDTTVDTYDLFHSRYPQAMHFHGEHRINDRSFMHSVVPVIRWVDDRQEQRQRPIIYIGMETTIGITEEGKGAHPRPLPKGGEDIGGAASSVHARNAVQPLPSFQKAVRMLTEHYQVYFVAPALSSDAGYCTDVTAWLTEYIGVPAWGHTIFTNRRDLLYGDYLISRTKEGDTMATLLHYGSDTFKTWDDIIEYFSRLGGQ